MLLSVRLKTKVWLSGGSLDSIVIVSSSECSLSECVSLELNRRCEVRMVLCCLYTRAAVSDLTVDVMRGAFTSYSIPVKTSDVQFVDPCDARNYFAIELAKPVTAVVVAAVVVAAVVLVYVRYG